LSRLSPKALRRYDELGLLPPAHVDAGSGYRWYVAGQLDRARLVALLRQIGVPLAQVKVILDLGAEAAAEQLDAYWAGVEAGHSARRDLAGYLIDRLNGKRSVMYEVGVRDIPARSLLSLQRHGHPDRLMLVGKEFFGRLRNEGVPRPDGVAGAPFVIYHGHVDEDSDGPIEWCWPVPHEQAKQIATRFPDLTLRTEAAHQEAFIHLETAQVNNAQTMILLETLLTWAGQQHRHPTGGIRQVLTPSPPSVGHHPGCDWAVPLTRIGPAHSSIRSLRDRA
jgi:DNA-binding transcriptional MerR regulator